LGRDDIFKLTVGNEVSKDNGIRIVNFAISKSLGVKSKMLTHQNIHIYTWTSPDGKTHNQTGNI